MKSNSRGVTERKVRIVAFAGALRKASSNAGLVRAAAQLAADMPNVDFEVVTDLVGKLPLYDGDVEAEGFKGVVREWREALRSADALLIATPEYNYSIPGTLKNAIDWASRPDDQSFASYPTADKPVALMGAGGVMGASLSGSLLRGRIVLCGLMAGVQVPAERSTICDKWECTSIGTFSISPK